MSETEVVLDRGDDLAAPAVEAVDNAAAEAAEVARLAEEKAAADAKTAEEKAAEEKDDKDDKDDKEDESDKDQPRTDDGKFAKKGEFIPKARVDAMVGKERMAREAAEAREAALQKQIQSVDRNAAVSELEATIVALEKDYSKAVLDGDADKMAELSGKIRLNERQIQISASQTMSGEAKDGAREEIRLDLVIDRLEVQYPQLNQENKDEFDQDATDMVLALQSTLIRENRLAPSVALAQAAERVMSKLYPAAAAETDTKALDAAKDVKDRKTKQVDKNLDAQAKQPASTKDVGLDSDKAGAGKNIDPTKLSQEEFNALPETTKSRLRGDEL